LTKKERFMRRTRRLLPVIAAATLIALPVTSQARVNIDVDIGPPAAIYEAPPPPRAGYVWTPGYWNWDAGHHQHVWRQGQYVRAHPGEHWVPHEWVEHGGRYRLSDGHWERDGYHR
jgi:hypothetical protein